MVFGLKVSEMKVFFFVRCFQGSLRPKPYTLKLGKLGFRDDGVEGALENLFISFARWV